MNADADRIVSPELSAGEQLVWAGRPRTGFRLVGADAFMIPLSLLWCGIGVLLPMNVVTPRGDETLHLVVQLSFIPMGLYLVFGRFITDAIRRGRTFYGLTPRRVIIVSGIFGRHVKSVDVTSLAELSISERSDRSGTITLGKPSTKAFAATFTGPSWPGSGNYLPPMLEMIEDAKTVYESIRACRVAK